MRAILNGLFLCEDSRGEQTLQIYDAPTTTEQITLAYEWLLDWTGTLVICSFDDRVFDMLFPRLFFSTHIVIERKCPRENARRILNTKFKLATRLVVRCDVPASCIENFVVNNAVLQLECRYTRLLFDVLRFSNVQDLNVTTVCRHQITSCPKLNRLRVQMSSLIESTPSFYVFAQNVRFLFIRGNFGRNTQGVQPMSCAFLSAHVDYQRFNPDFVASLSVPEIELLLPKRTIVRTKPDFSSLRASRLVLSPAIPMVAPVGRGKLILYDWTPDVDLGPSILNTVVVSCDPVFVPQAFAIKCRCLHLWTEHRLDQLWYAEHNPFYDAPPQLVNVNASDIAFQKKCAARIAIRVLSERFDLDGDHSIRSRVLEYLM